MTRPVNIATKVLRVAVALLLVLQGVQAGAAALRMEIAETGTGRTFIVICTPNGPKTFVPAGHPPVAPRDTVECNCPSATKCNSNALAGPTSTAGSDCSNRAQETRALT